MFVADASIVLKWLLVDQATDDAMRAYRLAKRSAIVVPAIWHYEIQNAVLKLVRRKMLEQDDAAEIRMELQFLSKRFDEPPTDAVIEQTWIIANTHMMTFYDASYVELAWRLDLPLATDDQAEKNAAKALGIKLV
jgi:predicted nucleic acid-binding protein